MKVSRTVQKILSYYESDNPGVKANLCRMLMQGRLGGTGKMIILPVDQGFEHGPARSFAPNPAAYDPHYHYQLAIDAGLNAYAAPLGMIEAGADTFAGQIPTILKLNSSNSLVPGSAPFNQAITASSTTRCGSAARRSASRSIRARPRASTCSRRSRRCARKRRPRASPTVIWSYPRGEDLSKDGETAIDVGAYAAQIAALLGAHIIKIKLSTDHLEQAEAKKVYEKHGIDVVDAGRARPPLRAGGVRRPAHRRLLGRRRQGHRCGLRRRPRDPRRRRQRLDHRPQHLPAVARGRDGDARQAGRDLQGPRLTLGRGFPGARLICHASSRAVKDGRQNRMTMRQDFEPRGGFAATVFAVIALALMAYLTFAALQGEHGLFSLFKVETEEKRLQDELAALQAERAVLTNRTRRLSAGSSRPRSARRTGAQGARSRAPRRDHRPLDARTFRGRFRGFNRRRSPV